MYALIRRLCAEMGISIRDLETQAMVGTNTICRWDTKIPAVDKVERVAKVLGVTVDYLLENSKEN